MIMSAEMIAVSPVEHRAHDREPKIYPDNTSGIFRVGYYKDPASTVRSFKSTGERTPAGAAAWLKRERDRLGAVARGHEVEATAKQARATIGDVLDCLIPACTDEKARTLRSIESYVRVHLRPRFGHLRADGFTLKHVIDERRHWRRDGAADGSVNRYLTYLKRSFDDALAVGVIARVPDFDWPWYDESESVRRELVTDAELAQVNRAEPRPIARLFNEWGFHFGMRRDEAEGLRWDRHIDRATYTLTLDPVDTKNKDDRVLPIPPEFPEGRALIDALWTMRDLRCPYVFHHQGKRLFSANRWAAAWRRAGLPTKVPKRNATSRYRPPVKVFHDLRATAAVNLRAIGIDRKIIMLITGHKSERVFDRHYNRIMAPHVAAAFAQLGAARARRPTAGPLARRATPARRATRSARPGRGAFAQRGSRPLALSYTATTG